MVFKACQKCVEIVIASVRGFIILKATWLVM